MAESRALEIVLSIKDKATRTVKPIQNSLRQVGTASEKAFRLARRGAAAAARAIGAVGRAVKVALGPLAILSTVLGGLSGAGLALMIKSAADFGDEVQKMSQRLGISTEKLSELRFQAELSGTEFKAVADSYKIAAKNLFDFQRGTGRAKDAFELLGISATDMDGVLRQIDDVVLEIADKFAQMEDGTEKAALAYKIFGGRGVELIPLLNSGSAGLQQMADDARALGIVIGQDAADSAANFNDQLSTFQASLRGLKFQVGASVFDDLAKTLRSAAFWIAENRDRISSLAKRAVEVGRDIGLGLFRVFTDASARSKLFNLLGEAADFLFGSFGQRAAQSFKNSFGSGYLEAIASVLNQGNLRVPGAFGLSSTPIFPGLDSKVRELREAAREYRDLPFVGGDDYERQVRNLGRLSNDLVEYVTRIDEAGGANSNAAPKIKLFTEQVKEQGEAIAETLSFADGFDEEAKRIEDFFESAVQIGRRAAADMHRAFSDNFFRATQQEFTSWAQFFKSLFRDLVNSILSILSDALASQVVSAFANLLGSAFSVAGGGGGSSFSGGPALPSFPAGPVFDPGLAGSSFDNGQLISLTSNASSSSSAGGGGGAQNVKIEIRAVDAQSFRDMLQRDPEGVVEVITSGVNRSNGARAALRGALG